MPESTFATLDSADAVPAIQAALDAGNDVRLGPGRYRVGRTLSLRKDGQRILGAGREATSLVAFGDYCDVIRGVDLEGVQIRDLTIDAAKDERKRVLTTRTTGIFLEQCVDPRILICRVTGTIGGPEVKGGKALPGVAIVMGADRGLIADCLIDDCGEKGEGLASDGAYIAGQYNVVRNCQAFDCTDTAFVLEQCSYSGAVACRAARCSAGLAITAIGSSLCVGNYADGITIADWDAPVTGGIQIGCPLPGSTGALLNTSLSRITMQRRQGRGPAVNARQTGSAWAVGLTMREMSILGAETQGILVDAEQVEISNCTVVEAENGIQLEPACRDVVIRNNRITDPWRFGVVVKCPTDEVLLSRNRIEGKGRMSWGVFSLGKGSSSPPLLDLGNVITGATTGGFGNEEKK